MSTDFRLYEAISAADLESRLSEFEWTITDSHNSSFCVCAGECQHLWCWVDDDGGLRDFTRFGNNDVDEMMNRISAEFGGQYVDEHTDFYHELEHWHKIERLQNKIKADPDNSDYYYSLGSAYFDLGENEKEAADAYLKATKGDTDKLLKIFADIDRGIDVRIPAAYGISYV